MYNKHAIDNISKLIKINTMPIKSPHFKSYPVNGKIYLWKVIL